MRILLGTCVISILLFALFREGLYADSGFWLFQRNGEGELVEFATNAFFQWKFEPFSQAIFRNIPHGFDLLMGIFLLLGVFGSRELERWFTASSGQSERASRNDTFLALPALILLVFGIDTVLISAFALFPWLLRDLLFLSSGYAPSRRVFFRFFLLSLGTVLICGQLSLFLSLLAFSLALVKGLDRERDGFFSILAILFLPAFLRLLLTPAPNLPPLPLGGHVVSAWGIIEHYRPLVGSDPDLLSYDWGKARSLYLLWTIPLALLSGLSSLSARVADDKSARERLSVLPITAFVLCCLLLLDTALVSPMVAKIMPLQSFSRVVPEYVHLPLAKIFFASASYLLVLSWCIAPSPVKTTFFFLCLLLSTILRATPEFAFVAPLQGGGSLAPLRSYLRSAETSEAVAKTLFSPSYAVYAKAGYERVRKLADGKPPEEFHSLRADEGTLHARFHPELLPRAVDGNPKTRWSAGGGKQNGREWFEIRFVKPEASLRTLRLDLGTFVSDFPRGLQVTAFNDSGASCERLQLSPWEGPLLFTESGYPYFGPQQEVLLRFIEDCAVAKVLVEQIAQESNFEWSVAEVQIPGPNTSK